MRTCPNCGKKSLTTMPRGQKAGNCICRSCGTEFPFGVMFPEHSDDRGNRSSKGTLDEFALDAVEAQGGSGGAKA